MPKSILPEPKLKKPVPKLRVAKYWSNDLSHDEKLYLHNQQELAKASLDMQHEALQKTLVYMHRTVLVSLIAVFVSILAVIIAVR